MPIAVKAGEDKNTFISRCIKTEYESGREQKQAAAICYSYWRKANEDVVKKLDRMISDEDGGATSTGDVATNTATATVVGMKYKKKKKKNKLGTETVVHETSYASGTQAVSTIVGSAQGRVIGDRSGEIKVLTRMPKPLRFNRLLGAYLPDYTEIEEPEQGDDE